MYLLKNVKVFDKNNPHFTIKQTNEEILNLFMEDRVPILKNELPAESEEWKIIGFVSNDRDFVFIESELFADAWVRDEYKDAKFKNYEVQVEHCGNDIYISKIMCIQFA